MAKSEELVRLEATLETRRILYQEMEGFADDWFRRHARFDERGLPVWDEALTHEVGMLGLKRLIYLAAIGDREAARWLADKGLGAPEIAFRVQIQEWDRDQVQGELFHELLALGNSELEAKRLIAEAEAGNMAPLLRALPAEAETVEAEFTEGDPL